ncbi:hypothetical protein QQF64_035105 [Cirrhinus molitorella]|uniref:Uncharacterized protein n=1 Tax=Cirrhinus molitorella TaxID=172907 RepID=A0ABR3NF48_9TELE
MWPAFPPPAAHFPISVIPWRAAVWGRMLHQAGGLMTGGGGVTIDSTVPVPFAHWPTMQRVTVTTVSVSYAKREVNKLREKNKKIACMDPFVMRL